MYFVECVDWASSRQMAVNRLDGWMGSLVTDIQLNACNTTACA